MTQGVQVVKYWNFKSPFKLQKEKFSINSLFPENISYVYRKFSINLRFVEILIFFENLR